MVSAKRKKRKAVNKRIIFPLNKNCDSNIQSEGFVKKIRLRFHYGKKLLLPAGNIYIYIYIYRERDREIDREREREIDI